MSRPEHPSSSLSYEDQSLKVILQMKALMAEGKPEAAWVAFENFKQGYLADGHTDQEFEVLQFNANNELARLRGQLQYPEDYI